MDLTSQNLGLLGSTTLHNMSVEELVSAEENAESRFHLSDGLWWREVKPFFYHPASPAASFLRGDSRPKTWRAIGGYYHRVPSNEANGQIVANELPDPSLYQLDRLKKQTRYEVRRGLSLFRLRKIRLEQEFLDAGYHICMQWEKRVGGVRVSRSDPAKFRSWATRVLSHPHNLVLGAYSEDRLAAFIIASAVDGVADLSKSFTDPEFYRLSPSSCLAHAYATVCSHSPGIRVVCSGLRSVNSQLDVYKHKLGYRHVSYPAFICLRPLVKPLVRRFLPREYRRLMGDYASQPPEAAVAA